MEVTGMGSAKNKEAIIEKYSYQASNKPIGNFSKKLLKDLFLRLRSEQEGNNLEEIAKKLLGNVDRCSIEKTLGFPFRVILKRIKNNEVKIIIGLNNISPEAAKEFNLPAGKVFNQGSFGRVRNALQIYPHTHKIALIKLKKQLTITASTRKEEALQKQASQNNPYVAKVFEGFEMAGTSQGLPIDKHYLPMDFAGQIDLAEIIDFLKDNPRKQSKYKLVLFKIMHDYLLGLQKMHENDVVHRDLKPKNTMLDFDKEKIQIIDFGLAAHYFKKGNAFQGTLGFRAPEIVARKFYELPKYYNQTKLDEFALGRILALLMDSVLMWNDSKIKPLLDILKKNPENDEESMQIFEELSSWRESIEKNIKNFSELALAIIGLVDTNQTRRKTVKEVLTMPFIKMRFSELAAKKDTVKKLFKELEAEIKKEQMPSMPIKNPNLERAALLAFDGMDEKKKDPSFDEFELEKFLVQTGAKGSLKSESLVEEEKIFNEEKPKEKESTMPEKKESLLKKDPAEVDIEDHKEETKKSTIPKMPPLSKKPKKVKKKIPKGSARIVSVTMIKTKTEIKKKGKGKKLVDKSKHK